MFALSYHAFLDESKGYLSTYEEFFKRIYITSNIQGLTRTVFKKFIGEEESPIHLLDTSFGGGKTHTLIALHHIFTNLDKAQNQNELKPYLSSTSIKPLVIGIDGHDLPGSSSAAEVKTL